jgi:hypothetical protein
MHQPRPHYGEGQIFAGAVSFDAAKRHGLDQRQVHSFAVAPADHGFDLILVHAAHGDHIDLDLKARLSRGFNPARDPGEIAQARYRAEFCRIERVERNVDAPDPRSYKLPGVSPKLAPVGGETQLLKRAALKMPGQRLHKPHDVLADQRFAARQAQLLHSLGDERRTKPVQLLQRQ